MDSRAKRKKLKGYLKDEKDCRFTSGVHDKLLRWIIEKKFGDVYTTQRRDDLDSMLRDMAACGELVLEFRGNRITAISLPADEIAENSLLVRNAELQRLLVAADVENTRLRQENADLREQIASSDTAFEELVEEVNANSPQAEHTTAASQNA